jgi:hypothetical protein
MKKLINRYHGCNGIVNACFDATALWLVAVIVLVIV